VTSESSVVWRSSGPSFGDQVAAVLIVKKVGGEVGGLHEEARRAGLSAANAKVRPSPPAAKYASPLRRR
jgi:hypothetical protein